jgi:hypothetical protein
MSQAPPPYQPPYQPSSGPPFYGLPPHHPKSVPALVLGILSLVFCGPFAGIPAMVMGRRAIRDIRSQPGRFGGEGLAQGGFWTGLVGTALTGLVILVFLVGSVVATAFDETCSTESGTTTSQC